MADPKKKKAKRGNKSTKKAEKWNWNPRRRKAALLLSTGLHKHQEVAALVQVGPQTISEWKTYKEFLDEIDRLTLQNELATRAGLLRLAYKGVDTNKPDLREDKNTTLDWAKFITDLLPEDTKESDDKLKELTDAIMASARK